MAYGINEFPNASYYGDDLRELIRKYNELLDIYHNLEKEIQETIEFVNNFEEHADELIREQIAATMSLYLQRLLAVEEQIKRLEEEINKDDGLSGKIEALQKATQDLQLQINNLSHAIESRILSLYELMHQYKHDISDYVDSQTKLLEQYIVDNVTRLDRLDVINPITGVFEGIQKVLDEMADIITRSYGLTAQQYDQLKLTARVYDGYRVTAYDYSTKGYFELYLKLTFDLMRSPFTGKIERFETIINRLAELHKCALTAAEYDGRLLTAQAYDDMEIPAYFYDWLGFKTVRQITAANYDALKMIADKYDNKKITAELYSKGMKALLDDLDITGTCGDYQVLAAQMTLMAAELDKMKKEVESVKPVKVTAGSTYVGICPIGQTTSKTFIQEIEDSSVVSIQAGRKVFPVMIVVEPHIGVTVQWPEGSTDTEPIAFNITVNTKKED